MFPAYSYMDSYPQPHPYQRCHIPYYPNNHHPSWEAKPEQVPATYGPWSYAGSYGYPSSVQCHGYCNQMYHPGYFPVRPPHSHIPPPSPLYHHGPFSPCEVYPPYHVPPHYSMEQPRYEYDKDMNGRHCCGCSNHACKQKEDKGVKIEEHEPETKEIGSLAPPNLERKHPYPFVWFPPEYLKNNSAKQVGDEKGNESQNDEDKKPQFPFPVYWLPAIDKLEESTNKDIKESNTSPKVEEQPVKFKIIPVTSPGSNGCDVMEDADRDRVLAKRAENDAKAKTIPVEPIGESGKNKPAENEKKLKEVHVKQVEESEKKSSDNNLKNQSSSPRKATKLPPVCLRVDPLPRKRSGNGTSRSPSPPGVKSNTNQNSDGTKSIAIPLERKESSGPAEQASLQNKVEEEQPKKEIKVVDVKENANGCKEEVSMSCDQPQSQTVTPDLCNSEISRIPTTVKENISETRGIGETFMEEGRVKKELSDTEAAVLIQSFYRGFEARKWEPLKKLKQIANVREQANQVRERIQTLKSPTELQNGEKQKVLIGETIMSLLLQLDTIQGLHPTVRDIRKSVARELVCLQERLDSLGCQTTNVEEKSEVTNSSGTSLQEASHETTFDSGCMSPDPNDKPKEIDQLSAEEVKGSTELPTQINPKDESHPTLPSLSDKDELIFEAMEDAEEGNEASGPPDSIEILPVTDKKTKMETESLRKPVSEVMSPEHQSTDVACDMDHGSEPVVGCSPEQFPQGVPDEMPPSIDDNQVLLLGKQKDSLLEAVVNEKTPVDLQNPELAVGKGDFELQDEGFNDVREDILTSQMVEEKQEDAEYMTEVNEKVPSDLEKAELALGNDDNGLDHMKDDVLAPERVEEKHEDADCATEIVNKKPPLLDMAEAMNEMPSFDSVNANPVLRKDDFLASPMGMVVEKHNEAVDVVASSMVEDEHNEDAVEVSQNELEQESTKIPDSESIAEIPENGIHFHDKDVISECASLTGIDRPNEELKDSGLTKYVEQEVPVKEELILKSQEREAADDKGLLEENEKLREVLGKLIQEGKQQLTVISNLNGRLKELERKLAKKKKLKMRRHKAPACKKLDNKCSV